MVNYPTGLQAAKSRLKQTLQDKQPGLYNKKIARKQSDSEGTYGVEETQETLQAMDSPYLDLDSNTNVKNQPNKNP